MIEREDTKALQEVRELTREQAVYREVTKPKEINVKMIKEIKQEGNISKQF